MLKTTLLLIGFLSGTVSAFVVPKEWGQKCRESDVIVRGVVVEVVQLAKAAEDSRGSGDTDKAFTGPNAVAVVRVTELLKGGKEAVGGIIFIPCGYTFDESPAELTKAKEYLLFLRTMGNHYFHPLDPFSMHRIQLGKVGASGFDTDSDFEPGVKEKEPVPYEEFSRRIRDALQAAGK